MPDLRETNASDAADVERLRAELAEILEAQRKLCHNINNPLSVLRARPRVTVR